MSQVKRREALLNEYKGNLYEFLVAQDLSRLHSIESEFFGNLGEDFYEMLSQQESFVREYYPWLLGDLPLLAKGMAKEIDRCLGASVTNVKIIGKSANNLAAQGGESFGEGDILVSLGNGSLAPISLKLSKAGAFVNTKSGGIKSFLRKYFHSFPDAEDIQDEVGAFFDRQYEMLSYSLQEAQGLDPDENFGGWRLAGMSELPGELPEPLRRRYLDTLWQVNNKLFELVQKMALTNTEKFILCLGPLLGYSRDDIVQATTFYVGKEKEYLLSSHKVEQGLEARSGLKFKRVENRKGASSFDVVFADRILQIRLKAMNKFTAKGFKVNCAVRLLEP